MDGISYFRQTSYSCLIDEKQVTNEATNALNNVYDAAQGSADKELTFQAVLNTIIVHFQDLGEDVKEAFVVLTSCTKNPRRERSLCRVNFVQKKSR